MKTKLMRYFLQMTFLWLLLPLVSPAQRYKPASITIINPIARPRPDEMVVLSREMVQNRLGLIGRSGAVGLQKDGRPLLLQFDDLNNDGSWDEVAFLYSFKSRERAVFTVTKGRAIVPNALVRAHVRQRRKLNNDTFGPVLSRDSIPAGQPNTDFSKQQLPPFLTEGPAWENDRVGFRIYMDVRNIKDIWGKTTPAMMMDTVGVNPSVIYHHLADWGMDILAVGKSLGAGSLGLLVPVKSGKDTLVRLGGDNMGPVYYEKVADGPLRAIFRMYYPTWRVLDGSPTVRLTEEISIWGGQYFYQSKVFFSGAPEGASLVTGMVNLKSDRSKIITAGTAKALYSFAQQSENKDNLGLAVAVANGNEVTFGETPKQGGNGVLSTYTIHVPIKKNKPVQFRFYAGWELSSKTFTNEAGFRSFLDNELEKYANTLIVK